MVNKLTTHYQLKSLRRGWENITSSSIKTNKLKNIPLITNLLIALICNFILLYNHDKNMKFRTEDISNVYIIIDSG